MMPSSKHLIIPATTLAFMAAGLSLLPAAGYACATLYMVSALINFSRAIAIYTDIERAAPARPANNLRPPVRANRPAGAQPPRAHFLIAFQNAERAHRARNDAQCSPLSKRERGPQ